MTILRHVIRFIVAAIVLMIVGFLVPGFTVSSFWTALFAAIVIAAIGWVIEAMFGDRVSPFSRGIVGFIVSAIVIYVTQFIVSGFHVTVLGALLASLVIGIVDLFIPIKNHMDLRNGDAGNRQNT
ncbi:phage holin family protein [Brevibacillus fluminis]|uniref:Phage holin family protein n=1 Tax=Brevibacillus fluminis TaxID=511487 RepID=A0A3M8DQG0_9BACL|nr:phage holin family protein [Brevibacillus fluminis]RNB90353.1 phage holin family protein [Brevibacillus fluminis]